jgi:hypothetical protein
MKKLINHPENVVVEAGADPGFASSVLLLESLREAAHSAP